MGLIKNIFGTIFGILGSIFKTVGGLVGLGKKSEFYLEMDEGSGNGSTAPAQPEASSAPATSEAKMPEKPAPAASQSEAPVPAANTPKAEPQPVAPKPVEITKVDVSNFATEYLSSPAAEMKRRRRPGPSLSPFREMAKQVKKPAGAR